MKVAVTADAHLTTRARKPERFNALQNILSQLQEKQIKHLIVAGDLFDQGTQDYSEFEALCRAYSQIQFHIIPGNHDPGLCEKDIAPSNVHVYSDPALVDFDSVPFLCLPYESGVLMGERIASMEDKLHAGNWVLIGHGDYYGGGRKPNPHEPRTYMPLVRADVERYDPRAVLLGHIHEHEDAGTGRVRYPGSPCGLDINETGRRRFLILDTDTFLVESCNVDTDVLYFNESFVLVPLPDEVDDLKRRITETIELWDLDPADCKKAEVRVRAYGYSSDKRAVVEALKAGFGGFRFYKDECPNADELLPSDDQRLEAIARRSIELVRELDWDFGGDQPDVDEVVRAALSLIYGKENA